jgi:hypothetical protein
LPTGPHFSVETIGSDVIHTDQQVLAGGASTIMAPIENVPAPIASMSFPLSDVGAAQQLQISRIGVELGAYDQLNNSCLSNARDILNAGGANLPGTNLRLVIWAAKIFKF